MDIKDAIGVVLAGGSLSFQQMQVVMQQIMTGAATPAQIGGFLVGLRQKGETVDEIAGAAEVMRALSSKVSVQGDALVDTCGTGGDGTNTFNISTTVTFVAAAAGAQVAKHGNRSISSRSGSADVLEAAGVRLDLTPEQVATCIDKLGVGFMFAPNHHSAMKHAIGPRKELGVRTVFNLLGPLTNPAGAPNQVMGVYDAQWLEPVAHVLHKLGSQHVLVVHGDGGLDELSISGPSDIAELKEGEVSRYQITPEQFGLQSAPLSTLAVDSVEQSLAMMRSVLNNEAGPATDIVVLNAGAAIYAANITRSLQDGIAMAQDVLAIGSAKEKLKELATLTQALVEVE